MEGMGLFNIAGTGGDSNMRTAVHTRRIINPMYGIKMTGTIGKTTFGVLNARDDSPGDGTDSDVGSRLGPPGGHDKPSPSPEPHLRPGGIQLCRRDLRPTPNAAAGTISSPAPTCSSSLDPVPDDQRHRSWRRRPDSNRRTGVGNRSGA